MNLTCPGVWHCLSQAFGGGPRPGEASSIKVRGVVPVGRVVSLIIRLNSTSNRGVSLLIGPDNIFTRMGSVLANRAVYYIY